MKKSYVPAWRFSSTLKHRQQIIRLLEFLLYALVWLAKIIGSLVVVVVYSLSVVAVFVAKNIWRLLKWSWPQIWEFITLDFWPVLKNIFVWFWKFTSKSYFFLKAKSPLFEKTVRLLGKVLALGIFYIFKVLYLILLYILKIVWYATVVFYIKFLGFFGEKFTKIYSGPEPIKKHWQAKTREFKLFLFWLVKPIVRHIPESYEKKIVPKGREVRVAMQPVIGFGDFKKLLREPNQLLLRRAMAGWLIFFLIVSTLGITSFTPLFDWLFRNRQPAYAATFTGAVKVSAASTTLSTNGAWYTAMAYSGDGVNGDAESGTFNPIHPGPSVTDGSAGALALGHVTVGATATYAAAQFIGFKPSASGNLRGVQLILENLTITSLSNVDIVVELLSFPSASCTTSCSNYVTGTQGAYTYPSDTVVLSRAVMQFNKGLSGENLAPGQYGRGTFDFRFDPEVAVTSGAHYGIRIINMGAGTPVFGTWAANAPYSNFPTINGTIRTIGTSDIDLTSSPTITMPLVTTGHNGLTAAAMVAGNSAAGTGLPTVRRTQNEHWTATYSSANANWTLAGTVSGTQTNKLTTPTTGGTGAAWVNDGVPFTALSADSTASTVLCVASTSGFAVNQTINLWDADTATVSLTVASVTDSHASCSNGPAIVTTAATVAGFTTSKNATVAQAIWKNRIVQGAITTLTANSAVSTRVCVTSITGFSAAVGTSASVQIWDNNTAPNVARRISSVNASDGACPSSGPSIILDANLTTGFDVADGAMIAEISANLSNVGTPADGAVLRFTSYNFTQNPIGLSSQLSRTTSVVLAYAKSQAVATSNTNYPFLSNRHIYFVAYGDANTNAPADGDIVVVGNGASNSDTGDSTNLTNDYVWLNKTQHVVSIDRSWDAAMAYTGNYGAAIGDGAGTRGNFAAYSPNGGWVSAVVTPGSKLTIADTANQHYRITIPGKIVLDSDSILAFGDSSDPLPASTYADIYFDNVSPAVSSNLGADSAASTSLTVVSTTGFAPGDTIVIDDNDSPAITRIVAAVENATTLTLTAAAVVGYTTAQSAFAAKGPQTELPTGTDRRAGVYTMTGLTGSSGGTQDNNRTGRVNLYGAGSDSFRTIKSDLAVDIDGNIDTGYLGNNSTDAGNTWVDVKDNVVGNWQPLDSVAVAGATNQVTDNNLSSVRMGGNDDGGTFPVWTGLANLGRNALPTPNMEVAEIGTVPITDIYNSDNNGGSPLYSANYATSTAWTLFGDGANTELNDAIYFGDQGNNMMYALEANLGTLMNADVILTWEFYNGAGWSSFTPRDAYKYQTRTGHTIPLSADTTRNSYTVSVTSGNQANFGVDQVVMIDDNDSSPIYRRISAVAAGVITFTEPVPAGYTTAQSATISRLNGGQWKSFNPSNFFTENGTGNSRRILAWTPYDLSGTPAKTIINGVNAYWVRVRISGFTSWTTSPVNQNTPIGMSGLERIDAGALNVSSGTQEAKIGQITTGLSYDPNETFTLEYGNSPGWIETHRYSAAAIVPPSAPYVWHIKDGQMNINETNLTHLNIQNTNVDTTDYTMSGLVYMDMVADATTRRLGFLMRQSLDGNGYAALITKTNAANTVGFYTTLAGVPTVIGSPTSKAFNVDTWYCLKSQVSGTTLNVKFWATTDCNSGEPGSWDFTTTNSTYTTGKPGIYVGSATSGSGTKAIFDSISTDTGWTDNFDDADYWRLVGSTAGPIGNAYPSVPFTSSYLNFTVKHKGGWNGTVRPEIGDKIYISSTAIRSYKGLDSSVGITTNNTNSKYEVWDFEWNPTNSNYDVTGSAYGAAGTASPGTTYTAPNSQVSLRINSGNPTGTKFGNRMLLLQDNYLRNNGAWTGINGMGSAVLLPPTWTLTGSSIATRYNIEGISGSATARQHGTIDFWFKTNYSGSPSTSTSPFGQYLLDYAANGDTDRLFVRHNTNGKLEVAVYAGATQGTLLQQTFSATAGQWYHLRIAWREAATAFKRAWLDGVAFETNQGTTLGARGANAGLLRLGNNWQYNGAFDGAIDEFNIFDYEVDTSGSCNWGNFDVPTTVWTGGGTAGCGSSVGTNIYRASFDAAMNSQEGWIWADYSYGSPNMIFTNGADTGNERIRVITYPQRTRVWVDNTGEKYTPSARIKYGSGHEENGTAATLAGWSHNFTYHHKAARDSSSSPTYSPVLNLKRSTHIWSDEEITYTGANVTAQTHLGAGFGTNSAATTYIGLAGLANMSLSHLSTENQYSNFTIATNPYTSVTPYPSQTISKSVFYNYFDRAYTVYAKTQGSNMVGAYFVTTHVGAANIGAGYNAIASQNVGIDGSVFMGHRNAYVTVPLAAAGGAVTFVSGRLYTVANSEFYNNGVTGAGTSGAVNFGVGVAKVDINDNKFSINTNGLRLYGNAFVAMSGNTFDGHVSDNSTTVGGEYGAGIRSAQSYSSVSITDDGSIFGRGMWNEADINLPPNTTTFEAESLLQFTGVDTQILSPVMFGTQDYDNMSRLGDHYMASTIPGTDIRMNYSSSTKDIVNQTTFGNMRTTGAGLVDTTVHTAGGYAWRMEPQNADVPLEYTAKVIGVANEPLAVTGYIRVNSYYGAENLPTVTLSGLGMTGANLTWTAENTANQWQQFVVSGTPTESALADLTISVQSSFVVEDSGSSEVIFNPLGNYLPPWVEDLDKAWTPNQWVGYLFKDTYGRIFEVVKNTPTILFLKGVVAPHLKSTTMTNATAGDYELFRRPYVYLDDVSVLSGTVDTGTLDFHSSGQPVSPWLSTGLTASSIWGAQVGSFADIDGSFGQLLNDRLAIKRGLVNDVGASTTSFITDMTQATSNFYQNQMIVMMSGQNAGIARRISSYNGTTKAITVDAALPFAPAFNDEFVILSYYSSASSGGGATAQEIWEYNIRRLSDATLTDGGSLATLADIQALNNISAADVWAVGSRTLTGGVSLDDPTQVWNVASALLSSAGSIGKLVVDNLDATISSRGTSDLTASDVWSAATRTITNIENDGLSALAAAVWSNATRELTSGDLTAQRVWDTLLTSISTVNSIGVLLKTNIDTTISSRASSADVADIAANLNTLISDLIVARKAVNDPSPSTTQFITTLTSASDDFYKDGVLVFTSGANTGQVRRISGYSGSTKQLTITPAFASAPADEDTFTILSATANASLDAAAVWSYGNRYLSGATLDTGSLATLSDLESTESTLSAQLNTLINNLIVAQKAVNDSGASTTQFITTLTSATNDFYNDGVLVFTSGANAGQVRRISDYNGANKQITISPALSVAPGDGDTFSIMSQTSNASVDAAAIWTYENRFLSGATLDSGSLAVLADLQSTETTLSNAISANSAKLDTLIDNLIVAQSSINDVSPSTTQFVTALTNASNDFYNDGVLVLTSGVSAGQVRKISDYDGSTKQITITPALSLAPSNGDTFTILASTASASLDASAIWSYATRRLTDAQLDSGSLATLSNLSSTESTLNSSITNVQNAVDLLSNDLVAIRSTVSTDTVTPSVAAFGTDLTSAVNDIYNNALITFTSGNNAGLARRIDDYDGASKTITIEPDLPQAPADNDSFTILKQLAVPVTKINTIQSDVAGIKDDVTTIKADIALIKAQLDTIEASIAALETSIDGIEVSGGGSTSNTVTNVYNIRPEEMFNSMNHIALLSIASTLPWDA